MSLAHIVAAVAAAALLAFLIWRRDRLPSERRLIGGVAVVALAIYASGLVGALPNPEKLIIDASKALGKWTYLLVGGMAFLETGAFVGFIAPGEFTVILGGVVAGQGEISVLALIGIVWACAILGDSASFFIGHRFGRSLMLKHGPKLKITRERFEVVERYFDKHGGKTIVIGRFLGFVRPLAPFIAGTSSMTYGRFLPYSVTGTGLWGTTFCLLGFFFWRSFDTVKKVAGTATLAFGVLVVLVLVVVWAYRRLREPAQRRLAARWIDRQTQRPLLRPLRPVWRYFGRPLLRVTWPQVRFLFGRLTPGNLGIEFTTCIAVAAAGSYVFILNAEIAADHKFPTGDAELLDIAKRLRHDTLVDVAKIVTDLGSFPVVATLVVIACVLLAFRRNPIELFTLLFGFIAIFIAVQLAKQGIDRGRPPGALVHIESPGYPSGHAAYSTVYVALAVIAARVLPNLVSRAAVVVVALVITALVGVTRVYLFVHYPSDVGGGWGLGFGILGAFGATALLIGHFRQNGSSR
jgi:undecaprenyl-diphosphatase